jgi:hypothetical protein
LTIRWSGDYRVLGQATAPVNIATTLYSDGRISFTYGAGNQTAAPYLDSLQTCGPKASGISNGHGTYVRDFRLDNYDKASTYTFTPPFGASSTPTGTITTLKAGDHTSDAFPVKGTASDSKSPVSSVDVFIDGVQREGVAPDAAGNWSAFIGSTTGLAPGEHSLIARITNARGAWADVPAAPLKFTVDAEQSVPAVIVVEKPAPGATISGAFTVSGYAYIPGDHLIQSVDTLIDGITRDHTVYPGFRFDLCDTLKQALYCPFIGFTGTFDSVQVSPPLANGAHTLQTRAVDTNGHVTLSNPMTIIVNNPAAKFAGMLETPAANATVSGVTTISGYVYSPGHRIINVVLNIDGSFYTGVTINQPRPDVCPKLPDANACPNIGFRINFDTGRLLNGLHILGIEAVNEVGEYFDFTGRNGIGMNIFVKN